MSLLPIQPMKIAVIGCGTIVQSVHLPMLRGQADVEVAWLVDTNHAHLQHAAAWCPAAQQASDLHEVTGVDAVIIATPHALHDAQVRAALERGWHVFVEKPLTTDIEHAQELVALAAARGKNLCVNLNRRFFPQVAAWRSLLQDRTLGRVQSVAMIDGGRWVGGAEGAATFHSSAQLSGGGVLLDTGSHVLDLALYLLDFPFVTQLTYADDGTTGLEAECRFVLDVTATSGDHVDVRGYFSRIAPLGQRMEIRCERAVVRVDFPSGDLEVVGWGGTAFPLTIRLDHAGDPISASFRASFREFLSGCRDPKYRSLHHAASTLPALLTMQRCYREKRPLPHPWESVSAPKHITSAGGAPKVIGIIGAGGFLGSRLFDRLRADARFVPRPITHSSLGSFAITRNTDAIHIGDAQSPEFLRSALQGVDVVVNCAINTRGARRFAIHSTRSIARTAAQIAGVVGAQRFVQISTIAIHGNFLGREGSELRRDPERSTYAVAKYAAEQDVLRACRRNGVDAVVLRLGHIYGPYALGWTVGQRDLVRSGTLPRVEGWRNPSNTVFIDNVVDAIVAAIEHSDPLRGAVFYVTDVPNKSWREFYEPFFAQEGRTWNALLDLSYPEVERLRREKQRNLAVQFAGCARALLGPVFGKQHLRELRERRAYQRLFITAESIIPEQAFRSFKAWLRRPAGGVGSGYPGQVLDGLLFDLASVYASSVRVPVEETVTRLGYRPSYDWEVAQRITMQWLQSLELTQLHSDT
ncbi:Gfo/Idh/MocA family oxidoreductase [Candidatus Uhrbacteria bacterium]|nr:Gfo/Idh/MocA family oxidoreductase [Candidatus Uhrbacteria bacterium]